jgi:dTDP-4-dehydrorhamnose 3,5-epimerase-like enzyme
MSHQIIAPSFERRDERGTFQEILNDGRWESLIHGNMKSGAVMGNHYHKHTSIFFYLTTGSVTIRTVNVGSGEKDEFHLGPGQGTILQINESHVIRFLKESEFIMLKSHKYDPDDPDTYRFLVGD